MHEKHFFIYMSTSFGTTGSCRVRERSTCSIHAASSYCDTHERVLYCIYLQLHGNCSIDGRFYRTVLKASVPQVGDFGIYVQVYTVARKSTLNFAVNSYTVYQNLPPMEQYPVQKIKTSQNWENCGYIQYNCSYVCTSRRPARWRMGWRSSRKEILMFN